MASIGVKLPLRLNSADGFTMIKSIRAMAKQNFKMLLLTLPGERIMEPNYGVGLKRYLFSNFHENTQGQIQTKIREQVKLYLPIIKINEIQFFSTPTEPNTLSMRISYQIPTIGTTDLLEITI
jgi:phage baseplate assembly protein W